METRLIEYADWLVSDGWRQVNRFRRKTGALSMRFEHGAAFIIVMGHRPKGDGDTTAKVNVPRD